MNKERFVERILETENLTDELEDAEANWLLDWGINQLNAVLQDTSDDELGGVRVNALMAVMRKINRLSAARQNKTPPSLSADLRALVELFGLAFGCPGRAEPASLQSVAAHLPGLSTPEAVEFLAGWGLETCRGS